MTNTTMKITITDDNLLTFITPDGGVTDKQFPANWSHKQILAWMEHFLATELGCTVKSTESVQ